MAAGLVLRALRVVSVTSLLAAPVAGQGAETAAPAGSRKRLRTQSVPAWCAYVPNSVGLSVCRERNGDDGGRGEAGPDGGDSVNGTQAAARWPKECADMPPRLRATSAACSYTEEAALEMAYLSAASYCGGLRQWDCGDACEAVRGVRSVHTVDDDELGAHAVVGRLSDESCFLAFRGTDSVNGWSQDFASAELVDLSGCTKDGDSCGVGRGFLEDWRALRAQVLRALESAGCSKEEPLSVTGHSLGGALATLALFDLANEGHAIRGAYTFGQPRVGDDAFAAEFHRRLHGVPVYRVAKANDPVVYMPARDPFHHVGREVYYPGSGGTVAEPAFVVCDGSGEDPHCQRSSGDVDVTAMLAQCLIPQDCGHLTYFQPKMQVLLDSESCISRGRGASGLPSIGSQWLP